MCKYTSSHVPVHGLFPQLIRFDLLNDKDVHICIDRCVVLTKIVVTVTIVILILSFFDFEDALLAAIFTSLQNFLLILIVLHLKSIFLIPKPLICALESKTNLLCQPGNVLLGPLIFFSVLQELSQSGSLLQCLRLKFESLSTF